MRDLSKIDKNFKVESNIGKTDVVWYDAQTSPFTIFGLIKDGTTYRRMDSDLAKRLNDKQYGLYHLHRNTAGGRITFETNSSYVAISMKEVVIEGSNMPFTGSRGFDLYADEGKGLDYYNTFVPPCDATEGYESVRELGKAKMRKILIHFPLYSDVADLKIGLEEGAEVKPFLPYKPQDPIVYYGSSITQGGCASRPGLAYPAIVSRKTMIDFFCMGFSGSAHGEPEMAEVIANMPMSAFVMDYDHNDIPFLENLEDKHWPFYETVRKKHPHIPIIIMSAPYTRPFAELMKKSRKIVLKTYQKAKERGDNVYFIDGMTVFGRKDRGNATVDGCHPNDYGFIKMADAVLRMLKQANDEICLKS